MSFVGPSWVGRTISGRYEIESILGRGGMSSVYRAFDPNLKRKVAVKIIHKHLTENQEFIQRFEQEAAVVAQLRHGHIVQVHDFNNEDDIYYMVMEFVAGETLAHKLEALKMAGLRMPLADTIRILTTVCDAVDYAHQRRMIHRDLKPSNVMIDLLGEPILMDFGIAKIIGGQTHTVTGAAMGTAAYMSPEQVKGETADHRSDIYSLGVILYEMLSGEPPFSGESTYQIMLQHVNKPLPDIQLVEANTPDSLVDILGRALAKNPAHRFQTAAEMAAALSTVGLQMQGPTDTLAARHLDRLGAMWHQARDLFDERDFARCIDKLDELKRADSDYQVQKRQQLRQQAFDRLHQQAIQAHDEARYDETLTAVKAIQERDPAYPHIQELGTKARAGLRKQALLAELNHSYEEAIQHLDNRAYQQALDKWHHIQQEKGTLPFPDRLAVEKRACEGLCIGLYNQAITSLTQNKPEEAIACWAEIMAIDATFPDTQQVVANAQTAIEKREQQQVRKNRLRLAAGGIVIIIVAVIGIGLFGGFWGGAAAPTATITPDATRLAAATTVMPTATNTPLPSATNTAVPTATATNTNTPSPTPLPSETPTETPIPLTAVVLENASLFTAPSISAEEITFIRSGNEVEVLGRSENSNWLYVSDGNGDQGFVFAELVQWPGDMETLDVIVVDIVTVPTLTPAASPDELTFVLYPLTETGRCEEGAWYMMIFMQGQGGDGNYTYTWNGETVGTAVNSHITFEISNVGGAIIGKGSVTSSDGQTVGRDLFVSSPACNE